jgi:ribosomal protein L40E
MDIQCNSHIPFFADLILTRSKRDPGNTGRPLAETNAFENVKEAPLILCRNCHYPITRPSERIEVASAHCHTFTNPNGYLFEIGCFRNADGCVTTGIRTDEFTWFSGYTWQIGICRKCLNHLGWHFQSIGDHFFGLILDRLTEK